MKKVLLTIMTMLLLVMASADAVELGGIWYNLVSKTTFEIVITENGKAIIVGDVDGDGKINVADHVMLSDIIMNKKNKKYYEETNNTSISHDMLLGSKCTDK